MIRRVGGRIAALFVAHRDAQGSEAIFAALAMTGKMRTNAEVNSTPSQANQL
jgi:hypothetical protein